MSDGLNITVTPAGVTFTIHVQPRASRNEICGLHGGEMKIRLTAPPVDDAANKLCIEFLARSLHIAKSLVSITAGSKSRHKTVHIEGIRPEEVLTLLGAI